MIEVGAARVRMTLRNPDTGEASRFDWPRDAVVEARANRFGPGLWVDVAGHVKATYLSELPRETIERLDVALTEALARSGAPATRPTRGDG